MTFFLPDQGLSATVLGCWILHQLGLHRLCSLALDSANVRSPPVGPSRHEREWARFSSTSKNSFSHLRRNLLAIETWRRVCRGIPCLVSASKYLTIAV